MGDLARNTSFVYPMGNSRNIRGHTANTQKRYFEKRRSKTVASARKWCIKQKKDYRLNTNFQHPINSSHPKTLLEINMEMEDEAAAPVYNLRPRPAQINADDVAFLATSKQKLFVSTREEDLQPPVEEVEVEVVEGGGGGDRRRHYPRLVVQTRDSRIPGHSRFASVTRSRGRRRNQTTLTTKNEEEIGLYNPVGIRKNERGGRLEHVQPSPITGGHRKPPATQGPSASARNGRGSTTKHGPNPAVDFRCGIENSMQHLMQEQILDTEDED
ncbi:hypothetical protein DAPPUDRAFT_117509 [Daphnia pulex]|uniref:Uncharacterized protein n=1 Tax=Daphnia pulex TaxID=6669 RepID=E9HSW9_DAPPU|nr:hypothetical protein DAPPUDRAFT_117509 [Daphnia pulex]|eukprot:EFX65166.1 hypothetical protein DAPPUDRAFT_117509 [Daphnia pulex]